MGTSELGPEASVGLTGLKGGLEGKPFLQGWYVVNYSQVVIDESEVCVKFYRGHKHKIEITTKADAFLTR